MHFGVLGQMRRGKGLEILIPLFQQDQQIGELTVAGSFNSETERQALELLSGFRGYEDRFLNEDDLLQLAAQQDYLLMLYDVWDGRMESAVLYLAARANRPVITYADGWSGRMVRQYGCGIVTTKSEKNIRQLLMNAPRPGTLEYQKLLDGVAAFREAHSPRILVPRFLEAFMA
jgi:hypothetical protein